MHCASSPRQWAIQEVLKRHDRAIAHLNGSGVRPVSEIFGEKTFSTRSMQEKLPKPVFEKIQDTIRRGQKLDRSIADVVAHAVKEWALENGVTHFCHWFQPMTGLTAEKHDSFLTFDDHGRPVEHFSGSQLIQSEPDASSFPSGGMRTTFEARGYTAWDPSSPIFIMDGPNGSTMCVPSVFISYHGEALDKKTPLLRSMKALNEAALRMLRIFGNKEANRVVPTVGPEQEYFLIDRAFAALRPDLISCGRTLLGARPPKGQQLEDHYFGSIKSRVQAFMQEVEHELYRLGIPIKTRHNEVAPSQFECAPIFEEANVAADHNQIVMEVMRQVARRHDFALLLHEKPFDGINGSGKHNNWSMMDSEGKNLLEPGKSPRENLQFLACLMATVRAVYQRAGLLRAAIANSGNDHRLGANEAPPAIISVFLGDELTKILDAIEHNTNDRQDTTERLIKVGISLPEVAQDATDRNRTSPFAFTGNKFEFRAVGSSASIAFPMTVLNAAVAESLIHVCEGIEAQREKGVPFDQAVMSVVREIISETKAIRFEGNNYADEWVAEAKRRGLPNLARTPEALEQMVRPEGIELFVNTGTLTEQEVRARYHIYLERYLKDVAIEVDTLADMARTQVLPAAIAHQGMLAQSIEAVTRVKGGQAPAAQLALLHACTHEINVLHDRLDALEGLMAKLDGVDEKERAKRYAYELVPAMASAREAADRLEEMVSDALWPLPKYPEMLFLS
jgi:glutamine synthetase